MVSTTADNGKRLETPETAGEGNLTFAVSSEGKQHVLQGKSG